MNIADLNNKMALLLIEERKKGETYVKCVSRLIDEYRDCFEEFDYNLYGVENKNALLTEIEEICQTVISCIESYNRAEIAKAIDMMTNAINKYSSKLRSLIIDDKGNYKNWYRIRPQEDFIKVYKAKEMFHIPFEMRYKVKNQRFSINGYPCLYLGRSVWGCWEEMHEIDFRFACVSRFEVQKRLTLLNVCIPEKDFQEVETDEICNLLRSWPLIIACSIKVDKPQEPYKPEYIIPQLLMIAIKQNEEFIGCSYTSTQRNDFFDWDEDLLCNIAIPVKKVKEEGLCPTLCSYFKVTDSGKEEYLRLKGEDNKLGIKKEGMDYVLQIQEEGYKASPFYFVEKKLNQKEAIVLH